MNDEVRKFIDNLIQICDDNQISLEEITQEISQRFKEKKNHRPFRDKAEEFSIIVWEGIGPTRKPEYTVEMLCAFHELLQSKHYITIEEVAAVFSCKCHITRRTAYQVIQLCRQRISDFIWENETFFNRYSPIPDLSKSVSVLEYVDLYISREF